MKQKQSVERTDEIWLSNVPNASVPVPETACLPVSLHRVHLELMEERALTPSTSTEETQQGVYWCVMVFSIPLL